MNTAWTVMRAETRNVWRQFVTRLTGQPWATGVFLFMALLLTLLVMKLIVFVTEHPENYQGVDTGYGQLLYIIFAILTMRNAGIAYRRGMRSPLLPLYLAQPLTPRGVMLGMYGALVLSSFGLAATGTGFYLAAGWIGRIDLAPSGDFLLLLALLLLLAPLCGFLLALLGALQPMRRKLAYLATFAVVLMALLLLINNSDEYPFLAQTVVAMALVILTLALLLADGLFAEICHSPRETATTHTTQTRLLDLSWLDRVVGRRVGTIARKEVIHALREKDVLGASIFTLILSLVLVAMWFSGPTPTEAMGGEWFFPMMLATCLYIGTLLQCTMLGAAILGVEGKRLWIFKSLPLESTTVMRGKGLALLFMAAPTMLLVWLPLPLVAQFDWKLTLFFGELTLLLLFVNTGLGIWAGVTFANFDEANRGNPDFMSQLVLIGTSVFLSFIVISLPLGLVMLDYNVGLVAGAAFCLVGYAIYRAGLRGAAGGYRAIFIDAYG